MRRSLLLAMSLAFSGFGIATGREPLVAKKPAVELRGLPVEDLIADGGIATIAVSSEPPAVGATETYCYALVRGVWPIERQSQSLARRMGRPVADASMTLLDFELQRQSSESEAGIDRAAWSPVDMEIAKNFLNRARAFEPLGIDPQAENAVVTAPLPQRVDGSWNDDASHPRLAGASDGEFVLFRYPDVGVQPGMSYRYRVRLKLLNPNERRLLSGVNGLGEAGDRHQWTEWSGPTNIVTVR